MKQINLFRLFLSLPGEGQQHITEESIKILHRLYDIPFSYPTLTTNLDRTAWSLTYLSIYRSNISNEDP